MSICEATREQVLDFNRARLGDAERPQVELHLQGCADCRRIFERERELDDALRRRSRIELPSSLSAELARRVSSRPVPRLSRWAVAAVLPLAAAAIFALVAGRAWFGPNDALVNEAVNDHLRVVYAEQPIEIASGGIHQVKPWFTGRLDFAPAVSFSGDEEFPLQGGAIAWFIDRKAATFVFKHKLHTITLFVFPSAGLDWPAYNPVKLAASSGNSARRRGFNTLLWRDGDLGYALVSDVDPAELVRLANKVSTR